jgi:hypothetical protein
MRNYRDVTNVLRCKFYVLHAFLDFCALCTSFFIDTKIDSSIEPQIEQ